MGKRLPRVVLPDFDYKQRPSERFEVPIGERIAAIRSRKADDRARAKAKAERRNGGSTPPARPHPSRGAVSGSGRSGGGGGGRGGRGAGSAGGRGGGPSR